jgi:hypothetical protein
MTHVIQNPEVELHSLGGLKDAACLNYLSQSPVVCNFIREEENNKYCREKGKKG